MRSPRDQPTMKFVSKDAQLQAKARQALLQGSLEPPVRRYSELRGIQDARHEA